MAIETISFKLKRGHHQREANYKGSEKEEEEMVSIVSQNMEPLSLRSTSRVVLNARVYAVSVGRRDPMDPLMLSLTKLDGYGWIMTSCSLPLA